jgi:hypothetical protein
MADGFEVSFEDKEVKQFVTDIVKGVEGVKKHKSEFVNLLSAIVFSDIKDHFLKEEGPSGKWVPWSSSYIAAIQGRVAFRKINNRTITLNPYQIEEWGIKPPRKMGKKLQATGILRDSFKPQSWRDSSQGIVWYNNAKTKGGFPYAYAHDTGGPKLPERKFMWASAKAVERMSKQTLSFILDKRGGK